MQQENGKNIELITDITDVVNNNAAYMHNIAESLTKRIGRLNKTSTCLIILSALLAYKVYKNEKEIDKLKLKVDKNEKVVKFN